MAALRSQQKRLDKQRPPLGESLIEDLKKIRYRAPALYRVVALAIADIVNAAQEGDSIFAYDIAAQGGTHSFAKAPYWEDDAADRWRATPSQLQAEQLVGDETAFAALTADQSDRLMKLVLDAALAETGLTISRLAETGHPAALIAAVDIMKRGLTQPAAINDELRRDLFLVSMFDVEPRA